MSAAAMDPGSGPPPDFDWQGAVTSALIGGAAMLARLLTLERASAPFIIRSGIIACICSYFVGEGTRHLFSPEQHGLYIVTIGLAGFGGPELVTYVISILPQLREKVSGFLGVKTPKGRGKRKRR